MNFKESVDAAEKSDEGEERNAKTILNCGETLNIYFRL
jgi:hypothetical protein